MRHTIKTHTTCHSYSVVFFCAAGNVRNSSSYWNRCTAESDSRTQIASWKWFERHYWSAAAPCILPKPTSPGITHAYYYFSFLQSRGPLPSKYKKLTSLLATVRNLVKFSYLTFKGRLNCSLQNTSQIWFSITLKRPRKKERKKEMLSSLLPLFLYLPTHIFP